MSKCYVEMVAVSCVSNGNRWYYNKSLVLIEMSNENNKFAE